MYPCPGNWVAIEHTVVYYAGLPTHLVQELNVGTVRYNYSKTVFWRLPVRPLITVDGLCSMELDIYLKFGSFYNGKIVTRQF